MSIASYKILGLDAGATPEQAKAAYRRLTTAYHPDRNPGDPHAEEMFKLVCNAYQRIVLEIKGNVVPSFSKPAAATPLQATCRRKRRGTRSERRFNWQLSEQYVGTHVDCTV